ncbi:proteinaceous RNase P 1, chloroplastic/mitochondrial isoform X1 [Dendrobium catenatum]|uniref:ribonuclease P n=1 Tax=Dendrobium catenatum TaxID=906689 RepID=A0A2I0VXC7_9ASPA|nr:proteinaceous RNase P 1, chloroplastic/mitochondrial isoform X1 [Dendrobium catenatum]PKU68049.1 Proteinaceous RNase P 1, chloroplastic/mitochondrial [Dendrobium catenatum]
MAPPFLYLKPICNYLFPDLPFSTGLHPLIPFKTSCACRFFFFAPFPAFSAAYSTSRPHAGKVVEKIPKRESFHAKRLVLEKNADYPPTNAGSEGNKGVLLAGYPSLRLRKEEGDEILKKDIGFNYEIKKKKKSHKAKLSSEEVEFRIGLDMCSKTGDALGAISLYDTAVEKGFKLQQYHYNVLLYLCSSAAIGFIYPAKSGSVSCSSTDKASDDDSMLQTLSKQKDFGSLKTPNLQFKESCSEDYGAESFDGEIFKIMEKNTGVVSLILSDDMRTYARRRGFEIFEKMRLEKVPMSEAAMTSVARMAMSMGNGDMAFEVVKQMKEMGITPRLRSYGPAILAFSSKGSVDKAFEVERHMIESGITPEEPELLALLRASVLAGRGEKVYYLLHRLRTIVRQVSPSTADVIDEWFKSSIASRVGKRKWDREAIKQVVENNGGGWHGLGWLGKGKWMVLRSHVNDEGVCSVCQEQLVNIDLDPVETENFAKSVASIAIKRDRNSNFEKFQKWLEYYGPFEAVIDAANVGLFKQRRFSVNKVNAVANGIRQKLPLKKPPLIIVHNKRLFGSKMNEPFNKKLLEKWKNADAIYATPTGSNDDWYWLYAAIKCKCLVVTNDEMRDHVFQVLGNDFFPRWKERHQVRFKHQDGNFQFLMPPPCSIVIQESERGHWHIPIADCEQGSNRAWMCVTRASSNTMEAASPTPLKGLFDDNINEITASDDQIAKRFSSSSDENHTKGSHFPSKLLPPKNIKKRSQMFTASNQFPKLQIFSAIEAAEKIAGCVIDFQI